mmetsp:Transcript_109153/g.348420  ORF Transcript_109153/g.348420 Transcript_109153/m.348420 type:complete len:104 (+) Transcript_109153:91-402(+)
MAFHLVLLTALVSFGCERGALADTNMRASGSSWGGAEAGPTFPDLSKDASSGRQASDEPRQLTGSGGCTCLECPGEWQTAVIYNYEVPPDPVPSAGGACSEGE